MKMNLIITQRISKTVGHDLHQVSLHINAILGFSFDDIVTTIVYSCHRWYVIR
jgi:hypothetical protein